MHIPDGYLGPPTFGALWAAMVPAWGYALRNVRDEVAAMHVPRLAMASAFCFLAMLFSLPLPGGTTAHVNGAALVAVLLGPWSAVLAVSVALAIQGILLGDGGIAALGANCFNIALAGSLAGYGTYRLLGGRKPGADPSPPVPGDPGGALPRRDLFAAGAGAYLAVNVGALLTACELGIQPFLHRTAGGGPLYFPYPLKVTLPAFLLPHLSAGGLLEAGVTVAALAFLKGAPRASRPRSATLLALVGAGSLLLAGPPPARAHSIHYEVREGGIVVRAYYSKETPAGNAPFALYGPGDEAPYLSGHTDPEGFVAFAPDRAGTWRLTLTGTSPHGFHGATIEIRVDRAMDLADWSRPLVATHTKAIVGGSVLLALFGAYALLRSAKRSGGAR